MSRVVRQDYIARIRYQNNLPPPQCPPKLVNIPFDISALTSAGFLSTLVQQQPLNVDIDSELGMPLDMTAISGVFDKGDESKLYPDRNPPALHPTDRLLLRDPSSLGAAAKSQPGVSFLRRTEYISTDAVKQARSSRALAAAAAKATEVSDDDPRNQVEKIDATFYSAAEDLKTFKHPIKRDLKVVDSFEFVPDVEMFDLTQLLMKMAGSTGNNKDENSDSRYDVAVVRPVGTQKETFMSFYVADQESADRFKHKLMLSKEEDEAERKEERGESPMDEDGTGAYGETFRFVHTRDYEIANQDTNEVTFQIDEKNKKAYFNPVGARMVLKRRRQIQDDKRKKEAVTNDVAAIELTFRPLSGEEQIDRDSMRNLQYGYAPE
ncbi:RNA polymerase II-associated [Lipomyces arxii]|uniref:RNA polymerase II-associated n=1 Tax=Lipomyces arxii TaxID=56418 RepID=UPI0034CE3379